MEKKLLPFFLLMAVFLAGCSILGPGDGGPEPEPSIQGKDGLVMQFFDDAPPERVVVDFGDDQNRVNVGVLIENRGAFNLNCEYGCGYFFIDGGKYIEPVDPGSRMLKDSLDSAAAETIIRARVSSGSGGRVAVEMEATLHDPGDATSSTVFANVCYPYRTFLSVPVCIETAHYAVENRVCNPEPIVFSSQGAPVAITRIQQDSVVKANMIMPRLKIFIRNVGGGFVIKEDALSTACGEGESEDIIGKVKVDEATISGMDLDCTGKDVSLRGPNSFIQCTLKEGGFERNTDNNLVSPLKIALSYGYHTVESKTVRIEVLDEKPRVTRATSSKTTVETSGETFNIVAVATDDNGLEEIKISSLSGISCDGETGCTAACDGKTRCTAEFKITKGGKLGGVLNYTITAKDTEGRESRPKKVWVKVGFCDEFPEGEYVCQDSDSCYSDPDTDLYLLPDEARYECRDKYHICCAVTDPPETEQGPEDQNGNQGTPGQQTYCNNLPDHTCIEDTQDCENLKKDGTSWLPDREGYSCENKYHICCIKGSSNGNQGTPGQQTYCNNLPDHTCIEDTQDCENLKKDGTSWLPDREGYSCENKYHICCIKGSSNGNQGTPGQQTYCNNLPDHRCIRDTQDCEDLDREGIEIWWPDESDSVCRNDDDICCTKESPPEIPTPPAPSYTGGPAII